MPLFVVVLVIFICAGVSTATFVAALQDKRYSDAAIWWSIVFFISTVLLGGVVGCVLGAPSVILKQQENITGTRSLVEVSECCYAVDIGKEYRVYCKIDDYRIDEDAVPAEKTTIIFVGVGEEYRVETIEEITDYSQSFGIVQYRYSEKTIKYKLFIPKDSVRKCPLPIDDGR